MVADVSDGVWRCYVMYELIRSRFGSQIVLMTSYDALTLVKQIP